MANLLMRITANADFMMQFGVLVEQPGETLTKMTNRYEAGVHQKYCCSWSGHSPFQEYDD
ncbi:hypothetical protein C0Z16_05020 [Paraburkholderia rhynchosiae]|uniref:Uncharacterized protein n=1 Tax=Paraburkholderia rhynchosiae TaxID=487049 RepID=A0ABX4V9R6_9BURK|nr:hypothetical protein [Paraburkholderia rhynchosiae]PMS32908.1 hypothetical protein C0Z16_05020 [Paraburkholderia rhynchosiae]